MSRTYFPNSIQFDMINENLVKIAAAIEGRVDYSTWEGIQKAVRMGMGATMFPVGTVLTVSHTTYGEIPLQVVGHNQLRSAVNPSAPTMTLICKNPIFEAEMCTPQALVTLETALPAGTYCFNITVSMGEWRSGYYSVTIKKPLQRGAQIGISGDFGIPLTSCILVTYASASDESPYERVSLESGQNGTDLTEFFGEANNISRAVFGSNNYENSAIRQLLNSSEKAGSVWTPKTKFDRAPSWVNEKDGFLCGLDASFVSVVGAVEWPCVTNAVYDEKGVRVNYTVKDKFALASGKEICGTSDYPTDSSVQFDFFNGRNKAELIKDNKNWHLRSAEIGVSYGFDIIDNNGNKSYMPSSISGGILPVCNIV
ncbi:MAG: hypothetical protein IKU89_04790 [Oscillospiraceae bacterium]|nr:hypothetical protein [Oscillospiraceae bacterium]